MGLNTWSLLDENKFIEWNPRVGKKALVICILIICQQFFVLNKTEDAAVELG